MCESCGAHPGKSSEGENKQKKSLDVEITYCME